MKKIYSKFYLAAAAFVLAGHMNSQCASTVQLGSSSNMFSVIRNGNNPMSVDKSMNMVAFIHRQNASTWGGTSGQLRFDYSLNSGTTWTVDQGLLNPATSSYARYPNMAIYNPSGNTNPSNAYVSYLAPTIATATSAWNGDVTGVSKLNVSGVTETYNQNGIGLYVQIPQSQVTGSPGVMWAVDPSGYSGTPSFYIYKATWNAGTSDFVWNYNYTITPTYASTSLPLNTDYNIAFDPTGTIGWFCTMSHVSPGPTNQGLYPVLYKTTNGGNSWSGPIQVDLTKLGCITSNTVSGYVPSSNGESKLVVDVNGNPHIITTIGSASSYIFNYGAWHHMFDITLRNGLWVAHDLGNVKGASFIAGTSPNTAQTGQTPQAARTSNGTKVFFTWTDNSNYSLGGANNAPNLFGKAYDVSQDKWTPTKDFTSCNSGIAGQIFFPHLAPEVLEPSTNVYKLAEMFGVPTTSNDLGVVANMYFLDNLTFASSEFSINVPTATVAIQQAPLVTYCPNSTLNINVVNAGEVMWSTGTNTLSLPITTGSISVYSATAQVGCLVGTASVALTNLTVAPVAITPSVCPGNAATFSVTGNAFSYTWSPGGTTGTSVSLIPTGTIVNVTAMGSSSCTSVFSVAVTILQQPTIIITGANTVCAGQTVSLTANGASGYNWSAGPSGATYTAIATTNTLISVIGTAANTCTNYQQVNVYVNDTPTVTASLSETAICVGHTMQIVGGGAVSYSWSTGAPGYTVAVSPSVTTTYTLTGVGANGCTTDLPVQVLVHSLPSLTVTPNRQNVCKGEKVILTAAGASQYTWTQPGSTSHSVQVTASATGVFTVTGEDNNGCQSVVLYTLAVSDCVSIAKHSENSALRIFPNPSSGAISIASGHTTTVRIFDAKGALVVSIDCNADSGFEHSVNLAAGIYIAVTNDSENVSKIVITR